MSQLGAPPTPPPYRQPTLPPTRPQSSDIPAWVVGLTGVLTLCLAALLAFVVFNGDDQTPTAAPPPRHVHHFPQHWNRKIAPLAKIAADQRDLHFKHPVPVRFLSPAAFRKSLRSEDGKVTHHDRVEVEQTAGMMRALGLLSGRVDLIHAMQHAGGAAVLAYYSFHDKRITVRGRTITPSIRSTLVHELTHVLQDQHFGIGRRLVQLQKAKGPTDSRYDVLDAIVEGDANRVKALYRSSLSARAQHALDAAQGKESADAQTGLAGIPHIIVTMMTSPYTLGLGLTGTVAADGGNAAVDRLLRKPPAHDSVLLDPLRALTGTTGAAKVKVPALGPGQRKLDSGEFGAVSWYLMLASRIPRRRRWPPPTAGAATRTSPTGRARPPAPG
jgi:hypothetical protein